MTDSSQNLIQQPELKTDAVDEISRELSIQLERKIYDCSVAGFEGVDVILNTNEMEWNVIPWNDNPPEIYGPFDGPNARYKLTRNSDD